MLPPPIRCTKEDEIGSVLWCTETSRFRSVIDLLVGGMLLLLRWVITIKALPTRHPIGKRERNLKLRCCCAQWMENPSSTFTIVIIVISYCVFFSNIYSFFFPFLYLYIKGVWPICFSPRKWINRNALEDKRACFSCSSVLVLYLRMYWVHDSALFGLFVFPDFPFLFTFYCVVVVFFLITQYRYYNYIQRLHRSKKISWEAMESVSLLGL